MVMRGREKCSADCEKKRLTKNWMELIYMPAASTVPITAVLGQDLPCEVIDVKVLYYGVQVLRTTYPWTGPGSACVD